MISLVCCSSCGHIKDNLGGAKVYKCKACGAVMDRDINGAKNIFLRNFEALGVLLCPPALGPDPSNL